VLLIPAFAQPQNFCGQLKKQKEMTKMEKEIISKLTIKNKKIVRWKSEEIVTPFRQRQADDNFLWILNSNTTKLFIDEADQSLRNFLETKLRRPKLNFELAYKNCMNFLDAVEFYS
jgi:uncharacterized protein YfaQ (DUF2300 family)